MKRQTMQTIKTEEKAAYRTQGLQCHLSINFICLHISLKFKKECHNSDKQTEMIS